MCKFLQGNLTSCCFFKGAKNMRQRGNVQGKNILRCRKGLLQAPPPEQLFRLIEQGGEQFGICRFTLDT
ncbi:MAG: hypothetical protein D3904_10330 [Candidatus Electrothrix sp. EH2]|nr:hypothetical protein [Candidatus Electrothrix sp. EH2]